MEKNPFDYNYFPSEIKKRQQKEINSFAKQFVLGIVVGVAIGLLVLKGLELFANYMGVK